MNILIYILVGLIAGALASHFVKGRGMGLVGNIIIGILGGLIGGFVFGAFGVQPTNILGSIVVAFVGAVILLGLARLFAR